MHGRFVGNKSSEYYLLNLHTSKTEKKKCWFTFAEEFLQFLVGITKRFRGWTTNHLNSQCLELKSRSTVSKNPHSSRTSKWHFKHTAKSNPDRENERIGSYSKQKQNSKERLTLRMLLYGCERPMKNHLPLTFITSASRSSIFVESGSSLWRLTSSRSVLAESSGCFTSTDMIQASRSTVRFVVTFKETTAVRHARIESLIKTQWDALKLGRTHSFEIQYLCIHYSALCLLQADQSETILVT